MWCILVIFHFQKDNNFNVSLPLFEFGKFMNLPRKVIHGSKDVVEVIINEKIIYIYIIKIKVLNLLV